MAMHYHVNWWARFQILTTGSGTAANTIETRWKLQGYELYNYKLIKVTFSRMREIPATCETGSLVPWLTMWLEYKHYCPTLIQSTSAQTGFEHTTCALRVPHPNHYTKMYSLILEAAQMWPLTSPRWKAKADIARPLLSNRNACLQVGQ